MHPDPALTLMAAARAGHDARGRKIYRVPAEGGRATRTVAAARPVLAHRRAPCSYMCTSLWPVMVIFAWAWVAFRRKPPSAGTYSSVPVVASNGDL